MKIQCKLFSFPLDSRSVTRARVKMAVLRNLKTKGWKRVIPELQFFSVRGRYSRVSYQSHVSCLPKLNGRAATNIIKLEIHVSQNLAKLGLGGQLIRSDVVVRLCSVVS